MKNWENLKDRRCPNCNCKLLFRRSGKPYSIKANKKKLKNNFHDMYFCSRCTGFQISETKLKELLIDMNRKYLKDFKDNPLFKDGLLSL